MPVWRREPQELSYGEELRRRFKKYYGYKPCGFKLEELERVVRDAEKKDMLNAPQSNIGSNTSSRTTIGDALDKRR